MRTTDPLRAEYERIKSIANPQQRGYEFQPFVGLLLGKEHFRVTPNPRAGRPRQVDLIATLGTDTYLVETKWITKPAGIDDLQSLQNRLDLTPSSTVGLFVSHSGFSPPAVSWVEEHPQRPIILVRGDEVEALANGILDLGSLMRQKQSSLTVHREVLFGVPATSTKNRRQSKTTLPSGDSEVVWSDGTRTNLVTGGGGFGHFTFTLEIPDIDWVAAPGHGVTLDASAALSSQKELIELLQTLSSLGWLTTAGRWTIQQATCNWHGHGADSFADSVNGWKQRYETLDQIHHTEEFCYVDRCDDLGFYTLTGQIDAHQARMVRHAAISFQLAGIPVDMRSWQTVCEALDAAHKNYFRPRSEKSVEKHHLKGGERKPLEVVGHIVEEEQFQKGGKREDEEWVAGIVVRNPYRELKSGEPRWLPQAIQDSDLLICALRSWHPLSRVKYAYRLDECEYAWTTDACVVRLLADWDDKRPRKRSERIPCR